MPTVDEFQAAQTAEWDEYVAIAPINIGGARAFNPGDPVPTSHVERGVVNADSVARRQFMASEAVTEAAEADTEKEG